MSAEDFNNGQSGQNNQQFSDQPQSQMQAQDGVTEPADEPLDENNDTGTEALTGTAPQEGLGEQEVDNAGTDNFASEDESSVEEIDTDLTTESAGGAKPANSEDEDGDGI